jgi:hypothetical protein
MIDQLHQPRVDILHDKTKVEIKKRKKEGGKREEGKNQRFREKLY